MSKYITNFVDKYANTGYGRVVILGENKDDRIKIIHPIDFKDRWSSIDQSDVSLLPEYINIEVGFYSNKTHYNILKQLGKTKHLSHETIKYMDNLNDLSCIRTYTWYSEGYNIKDIIKHPQSERKLF